MNGTAQSAILANGTNWATRSQLHRENTLSIVAIRKGVTTPFPAAPSLINSGRQRTYSASYLLANNSGWGYLGTKFVGKTAPETTGVSAKGAFGGSIEFKFENGITNDEKEPLRRRLRDLWQCL